MLRARQKGEGVGLEEGGGGRGGRLQKFKRHPAAALTPFNSAKRRIGIENKLSFVDKKRIVRQRHKTQNFPGSNFLRAKTFRTKCAKPFLTTSLKSAFLPLTTLPKNAQ